MPWIKVRTDLHTDPKVVYMASRLKVRPAVIIGACVIVWSLADSHTKNGKLFGYSGDVIDDLVGVPGFFLVASEPAVDWLRKDAQGIVIPRFDTHNGDTAKTRAQAAQRASRFRNGDGVTKSAPRAEQAKSRASKEQASAEDIALCSKVAPPSGDACTMLARVGVDPKAINYITTKPGVDECTIEWAVWRFMQEQAVAAKGKRDPIDNPGGYVRNLVEKGRVPRKYRDDFNKRRLREQAAKLNGVHP